MVEIEQRTGPRGAIHVAGKAVSFFTFPPSPSSEIFVPLSIESPSPPPLLPNVRTVIIPTNVRAIRVTRSGGGGDYNVS